MLLLGVNYGLLYWGMQFVSSGLAAILQALTPVFGMVFAHVLLAHERITPVKIAALAIGIAGVSIIFADQLRFAGWRSLLGSSAVLAGAMFVALAYVLMKKHARNLDSGIIRGPDVRGVLPLSAFAVIVEGIRCHQVDDYSTVALSTWRSWLITGMWLKLLAAEAHGCDQTLVMGWRTAIR